jgi:hypothetical protein
MFDLLKFLRLDYRWTDVVNYLFTLFSEFTGESVEGIMRMRLVAEAIRTVKTGKAGLGRGRRRLKEELGGGRWERE